MSLDFLRQVTQEAHTAAQKAHNEVASIQRMLTDAIGAARSTEKRFDKLSDSLHTMESELSRAGHEVEITMHAALNRAI